MTTHHHDSQPADCGPCGTLPSEFVRLRYFYGKRLSVADFVDEQRYVTGKQRFHEQRLHGSGVLCGLRTDLFSADPIDATILRVHRGAAIDACGREIVVGCDECIDVDAWLGRQLAAHANFLATSVEPTDPTKLPLCVVLRYRECAAGPEAAPRDACGCDSTGCDYGRVREQYELDLIVKPRAAIVPDLFPPRDRLVHALARSPGGAAIVDHIAHLATAGCPAPSADGWLEIASFQAVLADPPSGGPTSPPPRKHVVSLASIAPAETILYETALLQELLLRDLAATMEAGSLADGPQIVRVDLDSTTAPTALVIHLSAPLLAATVTPITSPFALSPFTASTGWGAPAPGTTVAYDAAAATFTITPGAGTLVDGALFRLNTAVPAETPMVDAAMRPLRPLRFSFHFAVTKHATTGAFSLAVPPITP